MEDEKSPARVLVCDSVAQIGIDILSEHFTVDIRTGLEPTEFLNIIAYYDAVVVGNATEITSAVIEHAPRLKVIGRAGAGLDNIDVGTAKQRNIEVVNSPDANTASVAELTMALMLALSRHLPRADQGLKKGKWEKKKLIGMVLSGKILGIVGFGRIGREVARRAQAFGMKVIIHDNQVTTETIAEMDIESVYLEELCAKADFITLHIPICPETDNLIGKRQLALMKPSAYLINTSRGAVVDESALLEAINAGQISGAGLDVYASEHATHNELVQHPKVIATPHIAASTQDAQQSAATTVAHKIIATLIKKPQIDNPLSLRVVSLKDVFPHENIDPRRVDRLVERLKTATVFTNPPIVMEDNNQYIVLDGATRTTAFKKLSFPNIIVQLMKDETNFTLDTWFHAIRKVDPLTIVKLLDDLPDVSLIESQTGKVLEEMVDHGGLCYLITVNEKVYHIQPATDVNHLDALNKLTNTYIEASYVTRTTSSDIKSLRLKYPDMAALVIFPKYEIKQVLQIARSRRALPAGITRFIIPGRVMRLNADLEYLKSDRPIDEKNEWLYDLTMKKLDNDQARYYHEPVYLLDE